MPSKRSKPVPGDVGYKRPPVASRFRAGRSGNPKGRPKGSKNLKTLIRNVFTSPVTVTENGTARRVTKLEAIVMRHAQEALKGNDRAAVAALKMAAQIGVLEEANSEQDQVALSKSDEKILIEALGKQRGRKRT